MLVVFGSCVSACVGLLQRFVCLGCACVVSTRNTLTLERRPLLFFGGVDRSSVTDSRAHSAPMPFAASLTAMAARRNCWEEERGLGHLERMLVKRKVRRSTNVTPIPGRSGVLVLMVSLFLVAQQPSGIVGGVRHRHLPSGRQTAATPPRHLRHAAEGHVAPLSVGDVAPLRFFISWC